MKPDFKKVLRAFDEEPETLPPPDCFYPNRDWQLRFCKHCSLARASVVIGESGDEGREYICNRRARGVRNCPWESADREGYHQSVPLTPGPPPGSGGTQPPDDLVDSIFSPFYTNSADAKKKGHWSKSRRGIHYTCSACGGHSINGEHKYCPMCGTLME